MGPRAGLDAVVRRKIPSLCRHSNYRSSSPWPSALPLSYPAWRKLYFDELHGLHSSPNIVRVIKSRRMRSGGGGEEKNSQATPFHLFP
jgi:hypothetical protein